MAKKTAKTEAFEVACPCCGGVLKIDPEIQAVIAHKAPAVPKTFEDLDAAARAMKEQDVRKESLFRQSVEAEKHKSELLDKKFQEAFRRAKEEPDTKPLVRDIDLD
jgi:Zn-finger nucleic acid-binding protein